MKANDTVYLKDGRKASYDSKLGERHAVNVYHTYHEEDGEYEDLGETIVVNEVFSKAPTEVVSKRIKQLEDERGKLAKEVQQLNIDKRELTNYIHQKTDFKKHIINKKQFMNAKSLAFFASGKLMPTTLEGDRIRGLKIALNISIFKNEERSWGYKLYHDYGDYSEYIQDNESDILFDKTDEEIEVITIERIKKIQDPTKIQDRLWINIDDKYLTKELVNYKNAIISKENKEEKAKKQDQIDKAKKELEILQAK